jgi:hypothetical protein
MQEHVTLKGWLNARFNVWDSTVRLWDGRTGAHIVATRPPASSDARYFSAKRSKLHRQLGASAERCGSRYTMHIQSHIKITNCTEAESCHIP